MTLLLAAVFLVLTGIRIWRGWTAAWELVQAAVLGGLTGWFASLHAWGGLELGLLVAIPCACLAVGLISRRRRDSDRRTDIGDRSMRAQRERESQGSMRAEKLRQDAQRPGPPQPPLPP